MKILVVVSHPRENSLTFSVASRFISGLAAAGHEAEMLDLHRIGFHPVLGEADEPDWSSSRKTYSPEVEAEIERMKACDALAFVFPIWWYYLPAMLKGYIDRVWNNGFAYGSNRLHHQKVLWLGLAAASREHFEKRQYGKTLSHLLNVGIAEYCGISNSQVEILYDTLDTKPEVFEQILARAYDLGLHYDNDVKAVGESPQQK
ncbi:NAD(P)H oxidoreductase [Paenibacillus flagellatus]|uniref:NAD(P)H oxidoreductase n=1 Tax=Paenibacillus flagellatus TaxID=2211139 RepID=A0A2V5K5H6_9BACL|nr:NAD(P)H oxidoreductase [Paenibacillus flagellatus]PYI54518.1 NAD(P)H oxidoreductase [Paenibacillus flagellatus]